MSAGVWGRSLMVELGQLVTRYDHMLHPRFRDHHQVSHTPADVVSAHGQSKSWGVGKRAMTQREGGGGRKTGTTKMDS